MHQSKQMLNLKNPNTRHTGILGHLKRSSIRIAGREEGEKAQLKNPETIYNKIIEENFPNLNKYMPIKVQKAHRTPNRLDQNRKPPWPHNSQSIIILR